ncbi:hypothetical protein ACFOY2_16815 [Nonomuraea purpurea]|uniref:Uncharacterized protein n=1 Tax=Nonomuraea purpurea TaxID=1849276 RepID=A0ABV8G4G2_9ACTN
MSVYGGLEFTEDSIQTTLLSFPGNVNPGAAVAPVATIPVGGQTIGVYAVNPANVGWLGAQRSTDHEVLQAGRVRLTNDTITSEWIVEGHRVNGLTVETMMANMRDDVASVVALRQQLRNAIATVRANHPNDYIVLAPGADHDIYPPGPTGLFVYAPSGDANGAAQITVQYSKVDTIRRICLLNASKYLPGKKVETGDDVDFVADTMGVMQKARYTQIVGQSATANAENLLQELIKLATPIAGVPGVILSKETVGLIMLMIVNDAMATTMRRYAATFGQTADKNMQRFFPKSRRREYVMALAKRPIDNVYFTALRTNLTNAAAAMAQLVWNSCDFTALDVARTQETMVPDSGALGPAQALAQTQKRGRDGGKVLDMEITGLKNAVLGEDGGLLSTRIDRAARAYTDCTNNDADHYTGGVGNVIRSLAFTPVVQHSYGAVYELRNQEVPITLDSREEVLTIMRKLFGAA